MNRRLAVAVVTVGLFIWGVALSADFSAPQRLKFSPHGSEALKGHTFPASLAGWALSFLVSPIKTLDDPTLGLLLGLKQAFTLLDCRVEVSKDTMEIRLSIDTIRIGGNAHQTSYQESPSETDSSRVEFTEDTQLAFQHSKAVLTMKKWSDSLSLDKAKVHAKYLLGAQKEGKYWEFDFYGRFEGTELKADSILPVRPEPKF